MTNAVQSSLEEVIASWLEHLITFENELENFTSQLAEKSNQDQINVMIQEFENNFINRDAVFYDNLREEEQDVDCDGLKNDNDDLEEYYDNLKEEVENYDNDDLKKDSDPVIQSSIINEVDEEYLEWAIISLFDDNGANL